MYVISDYISTVFTFMPQNIFVKYKEIGSKNIYFSVKNTLDYIFDVYIHILCLRKYYFS
jgi:hypothetical protein